MGYAQYPIWRQANLCLLDIERAVKRFPRYHKYTLGSELRHKAMRICQCIHRAFSRKYSRIKLVQQLSELIDDLKCQIQLAKELKAFTSFSQFQAVLEGGNLSKQAGSCFKHKDNYQLAERVFGRYTWLQLLFSLTPDHFAILPRYQPQAQLRYKAQVSFFSQYYRGYCLLIQYGKQIYLHHNTQLGSVEGCSVKQGVSQLPSWPILHAPRVRRQHEKQGIAYVLINEQGYTRMQTKRRAVRLIWQSTTFIS